MPAGNHEAEKGEPAKPVLKTNEDERYEGHESNCCAEGEPKHHGGGNASSSRGVNVDIGEVDAELVAWVSKEDNLECLA